MQTYICIYWVCNLTTDISQIPKASQVHELFQVSIFFSKLAGFKVYIQNNYQYLRYISKSRGTQVSSVSALYQSTLRQQFSISNLRSLWISDLVSHWNTCSHVDHTLAVLLCPFQGESLIIRGWNRKVHQYLQA